MGVDFLVVIFHALYIEDSAGSTPGSVLHTHTRTHTLSLKLNEKLSISPAYMQEFLFFLPLLRSSGKTPQKQLRRENRSVAFVGLTRGGWPRPNCFCGRWSCVSFALTRSVLIWCTGLTPSSAGDNTGTRHFQTVRGGRGRMDVGTLGRPVT